MRSFSWRIAIRRSRLETSTAFSESRNDGGAAGASEPVSAALMGFMESLGGLAEAPEIITDVVSGYSETVWPLTSTPCRSRASFAAARGVPVGYRLHERHGWRPDFDEIVSKITSKTRVLYVNSPSNPTGGVLTRADLERLAAIARDHKLWVISDEAYEDVVFDGEHVSIASLPGMYERTIPVYTFSKSYAMTGLRLGYVAIKDAAIRDRAKKVLFYTASNIASVVQFGGIGALEGSQDCIEAFRTELRARRDLFYKGVTEFATGVFSGAPPAGGL